MSHAFAHVFDVAIRLSDAADERAPGSAITRAPCGDWDHDGPCRWPHRTEVARRGDLVDATCRFDAPVDERDDVASRICPGRRLAARPRRPPHVMATR